MTQWPLRASLRHLQLVHRLCYGKRCMLACVAAANRSLSTTRWLFDKDKEVDKDKEILGRSTLMQQDRLNIKEMPIVMKRMSANELGFRNELYSGVRTERVTSREVAFREKLQRCNAVRDVFRLLEVPGDEVTPYSAAFALQRLCPLQEESALDINSFISKAILHELCETATRDIDKLSSETVISLVRCHSGSVREDCFPHRFVTEVNREVARRIGDSRLKVTEICTLIEILSECTHADEQLLDDLWVHLANRYREMDETNIATVYELCKFMNKKHKYMHEMFERRLRSCWWRLRVEDASSVAQALMLTNQHSHETLSLLAMWVAINLHEVRGDTMTQFLALFSQFSFNDANFMKALERFFVAKGDKIDIPVVIMAMEYCRKLRHLSTRIFDQSAAHFAQNAALYGPTDMYLVLRPFGQMNYVPHNADRVFEEVEIKLNDHLDEMWPLVALELLASFVCIERFPVNFYSSVFAIHFTDRLLESPFSSENSLSRAWNYLWTLSASLNLDKGNKARLSYVDPRVMYRTTSPQGANRWPGLLRFYRSFDSVLSPSLYLRQHYVRNTPHLINCTVFVSKDGLVIPLDDPQLEEKTDKRLAVLGTRPDDYVENTQQPLGALALTCRHLQILGYTVILIQMRFVNAWDIKYALKPHLRFPVGSLRPNVATGDVQVVKRGRDKKYMLQKFRLDPAEDPYRHLNAVHEVDRVWTERELFEPPEFDQLPDVDELLDAEAREALKGDSEESRRLLERLLLEKGIINADELGDDDEEVMDLGPEENFTPEKLEDETNEEMEKTPPGSEHSTTPSSTRGDEPEPT